MNLFFIELLFQEAKINNKRIPQYTKFLETLGVEENKLHLLTEECLFNFEEKYKKDHPDFVLVPRDAAAIEETAANWSEILSFRTQNLCLKKFINEQKLE